MKKLHVSSVSILFAALCLVFTACNQGVTAGNETGTVRVVIGGGATRSVDAAGLPVFDDTNTKITVTGKDGTKLKEGTTSVTLKLDIGTKITVKAVVTTAAGEWAGSAEHTVTAGTNTVAVKLSKAPKDVASLMFSITGKAPSGSNTVSLSTKTDKKLLDGILISSTKPVIARDSIGRIYVLYDKGSTKRFTRFDVEGNEDTGFETAITSAIPNFGRIKTMTVDPKTGTIFVAVLTGQTDVYAVTESGHNTFTCSNKVDLTTLPGIGTTGTLTAMAAYNDALFLIAIDKLIACKVTLSGTTLTLTKTAEATLPKLRPHSALNNTECTGLFADADGVYCLLSDQNLYGGTLYALGQIVRYQYSGSAFTGDTKIGLNPKAAGTDGIPFDAQYFSAPVGFIGYDEENIYIADDGVNIEYLNENYHINGNKNRIAAFNRKTNAITFEGTAATWYEQKPEYKYPNTKILLWEKGDGSSVYGMKYWLSGDGSNVSPGDADALFASNDPDKLPSDMFCYDQDGNLYILYKHSSDYKVRRFALQDDGTYDKFTAQDLSFQAGVSAIAVDVSDENHYLYYADGTTNEIKRYWWSSTFGNAVIQNYSITLPSAEKVTALAANKDGVFVATKKTYQESGIDKYRLKVQKYKKIDGTPDNEITLVDNAVSYTDVTTGDPIADPSPGNDPDQACNQYQETINGLQIANGMLYGISSKLHRKWLMNVITVYSPDVFKHSSILYKIGSTAEALPSSPLAKEARPVDDTNKVGYGFYRFIAVKYDEAERIRLIIASDSAWGKNGSGYSSPDMANTDTIVEFNLKDMVFGEDKESGGTFSKTLTSSGFFWN